MSGRKHKGVNAKRTASSHSDASPAVPSESATVNQSEQLPDKSHETSAASQNNTVSSASTGASFRLEGNSNQNSSTGVENGATGKAVRKHRSANKSNVPEPSGAVGGACGGNFEGLSSDDLETMIARQRELIDRVKAEREDFIHRIERAEAEIQLAAQRMYGAVDNRVNELLATADEVRSERSSQVEHARSQMQSMLASMNYHHAFAEQLLKHGTPAEVTHYAPLLHADAERILNETMPEVPQMSSDATDKLAALQAFANISLDDLRQQAGGNLVGSVTRTEAVDLNPPDGISPYLSQPTLTATTAVGNGVCGVAFLGVHLFVLCDRSPVVEVFVTSEGLALERQINVEQMTCPTSITASTSADCLFVTDSQVRGLFRIPSSTNAEVTLIPLDGIPSGLATAADGNIIVTFSDSQSLKTISAADGSVIAEIQVGSVVQPISAVPVNGQDNGFLVCSETENGSEWFICGHRLEGAARSLSEPVHIRSLDKISGFVPDPFGSYIAFNMAQNTVSLFNSTFEFERLLFSGSDSVEYPTSLALNPTSGCVAVGQQNGIVKLYKLMRTRETIEVGIYN